MQRTRRSGAEHGRRPHGRPGLAPQDDDESHVDSEPKIPLCLARLSGVDRSAGSRLSAQEQGAGSPGCEGRSSRRRPRHHPARAMPRVRSRCAPRRLTSTCSASPSEPAAALPAGSRGVSVHYVHAPRVMPGRATTSNMPLRPRHATHWQRTGLPLAPLQAVGNIHTFQLDPLFPQSTPRQLPSTLRAESKPNSCLHENLKYRAISSRYVIQPAQVEGTAPKRGILRRQDEAAPRSLQSVRSRRRSIADRPTPARLTPIAASRHGAPPGVPAECDSERPRRWRSSSHAPDQPPEGLAASPLPKPFLRCESMAIVCASCPSQFARKEVSEFSCRFDFLCVY
jgi:hypothetical protein